MNRRSFLKLVAGSFAVPYLPNMAVPEKVLTHIDPSFFWAKAMALGWQKRCDAIIIEALS